MILSGLYTLLNRYSPAEFFLNFREGVRTSNNKLSLDIDSFIIVETALWIGNAVADETTSARNVPDRDSRF